MKAVGPGLLGGFVVRVAGRKDLPLCNLRGNAASRTALAMIEDREIRLDGVRYLWSYDSQTKSPQDCWQWTIADQYMRPSTAIQSRLNRQFIDDGLPTLSRSWIRPRSTASTVFSQAMGATDEQLAAVFGDDPDRLPRQMATPMKRVAAKIPPAAHTPFNSPPVRDWFFTELCAIHGLSRRCRWKSAFWLRSLRDRGFRCIPEKPRCGAARD